MRSVVLIAAKRGAWVRVQGGYVRVAEIGLEEVRYEWRPLPKAKERRQDRIGQKKPPAVE